VKAPSPDAQDPGARPLRFDLLSGMGFGNADLDSGETVNTFGLVASLRASYALSFGGNLALRVDHFFGTSSSYPLPLVARVEHHRRADFAAIDLGFDIRTSHAVFRPYLGVGAIMFTKNVECTAAGGNGFDSLGAEMCSKVSSSEHPIQPAIAPGLSMALMLGRFFIVLDPRFYYQKESAAFASTAGVGLSL